MREACEGHFQQGTHCQREQVESPTHACVEFRCLKPLTEHILQKVHSDKLPLDDISAAAHMCVLLEQANHCRHSLSCLKCPGSCYAAR